MNDYYTQEETERKLGMDQGAIRSLVVEGKLREFRQEGNVLYKKEDVDAVAAAAGGAGSSGPIGLSTTGELILEPAEGSSAGDLSSAGGGMDLTGGGDLLSLADDEEESGASDDEPKKDDTVITSVGVNVFEGEELELEADPAAKTVLSDSDSGPLSVDSGGSASGLLDLTRESDDTSLGAELLDEIYPEGEGSGAGPGDSTKAGLAAEIGGGSRAGSGTRAGTGTRMGAGAREGTGIMGASGALGDVGFGSGSLPGTGSGSGTALDEALVSDEGGGAAVATAPSLQSAQAYYMADPYAGAFTGVMLISVIMLGLVGAVCAAFLRGSWPTYLGWINSNLMIFGGGALGLTVVVLAVGFMVNRPSGPSIPKPRKEKKPKEKKEKKPKKSKDKG